MIMNHKITKDEHIHPKHHLKEIKMYVYNPKGQLIWSGNSNLIFLDICAQISKKKLSGYYVINSLKEKCEISNTGHTKNDPRNMEKKQKALSIILGF